VDGTQLELLRYSDSSVPHLTDLCNMVWQQERADWKNGIIVPLPKKGDLSDCGNYRGITLFSVPGKVFSRVLLNRMQDAVDQLLRQQQAGFLHGSDFYLEADHRESDRRTSAGDSECY